MKYFLDTEFNEYHGELISLGLVSEDGRELYFEIDQPFNWKSWVQEHVRPLLTGPRISWEQAQRQLEAFFYGDVAPIIISDWPTDIQHLCDLLDVGNGKRLQPSRWEFILQGQMETFPEIPHHALSDARALKLAWQKRFP